VSVGLANAGAFVLVVMAGGSAYRLINEPSGLNARTWIALPPVPGTAAG
jgi:hypothetical protein